jgi:hypothetical protein
MDRVRKSVICSLGALAVAAGLWGCNGSDIDDPDFSDSVLIVDGVEPASLQSDVTTTTDPNSMVSNPPEDDIVTVKVRNLNRTQSGSGIFGDVQIDSFDLLCQNGTIGTIVSASGAASLTVPAEASADIKVGVFTSAFKQANAGTLLGQSGQCAIVFHGRDLSGEPLLSQEAVFAVNFVDTP